MRTLTVKDLKSRLLPVLKQHNVARAAVFGSVATGTATETSDLDILVEFQGEKNLLDLVSLKIDLEEKVHRKVNVVTYRSLNPLIRDKVLSEEMRIF
ncbi:nucleotidyltransferase [Dehalogenimonas sp. WBC-2]|nr:nucleotidyltransferase [Dehalogenimonas sp. WBC-2]